MQGENLITLGKDEDVDENSVDPQNSDTPLSILAQMPDIVGLPVIMNLNQKKSESIYSTL